jgi:hypothetical protein
MEKGTTKIKYMSDGNGNGSRLLCRYLGVIRLDDDSDSTYYYRVWKTVGLSLSVWVRLEPIYRQFGEWVKYEGKRTQFIYDAGTGFIRHDTTYEAE